MDSKLRICVFCRQALRQSVSVQRRTASAASSARHSARAISSSSTASSASIRRLAKPSPLLTAPTATLRSPRHQPYQRAFSKSASQHEQIAIQNPRQDDDGNEMVVEITPRAADRLKQIMTKDDNSGLALRINVESGGCHGFQYLMSLTDMSKVSGEEDTVFEGPDGARIVLDEPSLELLKGSKVDYTMELIGSQFKIVDNPHATSSCGCGTSFDIKA